MQCSIVVASQRTSIRTDFQFSSALISVMVLVWCMKIRFSAAD